MQLHRCRSADVCYHKVISCIGRIIKRKAAFYQRRQSCQVLRQKHNIPDQFLTPCDAVIRSSILITIAKIGRVFGTRMTSHARTFLATCCFSSLRGLRGSAICCMYVSAACSRISPTRRVSSNTVFHTAHTVLQQGHVLVSTSQKYDNRESRYHSANNTVIQVLCRFKLFELKEKKRSCFADVSREKTNTSWHLIEADRKNIFC